MTNPNCKGCWEICAPKEKEPYFSTKVGLTEQSREERQETMMKIKIYKIITNFLVLNPYPRETRFLYLDFMIYSGPS